MEGICIENDYDDRYKIMAQSQDSIGWQRFMEGMVCKEIRAIQSSYSSGTGLCCNTVNWGRDLVTRLLEVTHGQWLYRNVQVKTEYLGHLQRKRRKNCKWKSNASKSWTQKAC